MANHNDVKNKLSKLLEKSEPNLVKHQAIAIVGDWGIGKTYLWSNFYSDKKSSLNYDKYAYVSLFGVGSLEELKLKIATEIVSTNSADGLEKDIMPSFKKLLGGLSSARLSESGVSVGLGSSVVSSLVLSGLKDTIVCLDDLERRSKNLPIDEVMGLVNYLTQERNCSVVCLLNRDEIKDEIYENYKEKVFTYEFSIDDSLDVIFERLPKICHEIIQHFYYLFSIKNIRFYEKVIELYDEFITHVTEGELSNTSKSKILSSFLLFIAFDRMPKVMGFGLKKFVDDYSDENSINQLSFISDETTQEPLIEKEEKEREIKNKIQHFVPFFKIDKWELAILEFMNSYKLYSTTQNAIDEDLFEEKSLANKRQLDEVADEYYNLELQPNFSFRLAEAVKKNLKTVGYKSISFWCNELEGMGEMEKANEIVFLVKQQIDNEIEKYSDSNYLEKAYRFGNENSDDKFYDYIKSKLIKPFHPTKEKIVGLFIAFHQGDYWDISDKFLKKMTKEELKEVIWADLNQFKINRKIFIESVVKCNLLDEQQKKQFRQWAVEILQEKAAESNAEQKYVIDGFLEYSDDLKFPE